MENETFPRTLQMMRERRRMSRQVLGELCGLGKDTIRKYERGEREPTQASLIALADFFEVSIDRLVGRDSQKK